MQGFFLPGIADMHTPLCRFIQEQPALPVPKYAVASARQTAFMRPCQTRSQSLGRNMQQLRITLDTHKRRRSFRAPCPFCTSCTLDLQEHLLFQYECLLWPSSFAHACAPAGPGPDAFTIGMQQLRVLTLTTRNVGLRILCPACTEDEHFAFPVSTSSMCAPAGPGPAALERGVQQLRVALDAHKVTLDHLSNGRALASRLLQLQKTLADLPSTPESDRSACAKGVHM